jgi:hypothetical protein
MRVASKDPKWVAALLIPMLALRSTIVVKWPGPSTSTARKRYCIQFSRGAKLTLLNVDRYNPHWGEVKFLVINSLTEALNLTILDHNDHRKDTDLGSASFELSSLLEDATQEGLVRKILKDGKERGELKFDV